jgi:hypothetical protein
MAVKTVTESGNNVSAQDSNLLYQLARIVNQLQAAVEELKTDFNAHTHTENTAASYTQNATTSGPSVTVAATTPDSISFSSIGTPA